jgi:hypothetical protein
MSLLATMAMYGAGGVVSTAAGLVAGPFLEESLGYAPSPEELLTYYCTFNPFSSRC